MKACLKLQLFCPRKDQLATRLIQQNEKSTQNAISVPKLSDVLPYLFRVRLALYTAGIYHSSIQLSGTS